MTDQELRDVMQFCLDNWRPTYCAHVEAYWQDVAAAERYDVHVKAREEYQVELMHREFRALDIAIWEVERT